MRVATLVLAAGTSQRFGRPKQLEVLGDSTVLQHAVRAFTGVDRIAEVWVVTSEEHEDATRRLAAVTGLGGRVVAAATATGEDQDAQRNNGPPQQSHRGW